jgi:imidazoleglycerol phosphate synthase glutamine amidotransferase subunit HisH
VYILDYGAGNVQSVENAIKALGYNVNYIKDANDFLLADVIS